jgi:hypothetical protein
VAELPQSGYKKAVKWLNGRKKSVKWLESGHFEKY